MGSGSCARLSSRSWCCALWPEPGAGQTFTNENYEEVVADPEAHRGARAEIVGSVIQMPSSGAMEYNNFRMSVDPDAPFTVRLEWSGEVDDATPRTLVFEITP